MRSRSRFWSILLALVVLTSPRAHATVSIEFQFGAIPWPQGATGILVADTAGDGFDPVASAAGTALSPGYSLGGGDDRIVAVFPIGDLSFWNGQRGFAVLLNSIDYAALQVAAGQAIQFIGFPDRNTGDVIRTDEAHGVFSGNAAHLAGNMGLALPPDGGAYQLAVIDVQQGGRINLAEFGTPIPDIALEELPGVELNIGATVAFGSQYPKSATTKTFRIRNLGRGPLMGLGIVKSGAGGDAFSVSSVSTIVEAYGATTFTVTFGPKAAGAFEGTLSIVSNDSDEGNFSLNLSGIGLPDPRLEKPVIDPEEPHSAGLIQQVSWEDSVAGSYDGLLYDKTSKELVGNLSSVRLSRPAVGTTLGGAVSGTIRMNGRSATLRGTFTPEGMLDASLPQRIGPAVEVKLRLAQNGDTETKLIQGEVVWNGTTAEVTMHRALYHGFANPAPAAITGAYTMLLPSEPGWGTSQPGGDGWASVNISSGGAVSVNGQLGDGTSFT
jgi:hypothetical protein